MQQLGTLHGKGCLGECVSNLNRLAEEPEEVTASSEQIGVTKQEKSLQ